MNWLADNLVVLVGMLGVITAGLITGWAKTGNTRLLQCAIIPLALGVLAVAASWAYDSPEEKVRRALMATADAVEKGEVDAVLAAFVQEATGERAVIKANMALFRLSDVRIKNNLKIEVSDSGRRAVAEFNVTALASARNGMIKNRKVAFFFEVHYVRDGEKWLIDTYEEMTPEKGFQRPSARR